MGIVNSVEGVNAPPRHALVARWLVVVLGAWLIASPFVWKHSSSAAFNTWGCGMLVALFAVLVFYMPRTRFLNAGLAVWLAFSAVTLEHRTELTFWNNTLVAIAVFALSLLSGKRESGAPEGGRAAA